MERMTARDKSTLTWIGEQYIARYDLLCELLGGVKLRAMYKVLTRWKADNLVEVEEALVGQRFVSLTTTGLNRVGLDYPVKRIRLHNITHIHAIGAVRWWAQKRNGGLRWTSERELWTASDKAKAVPDGITAIDNYPTVVEVELNRKSTTVWQVKIGELANAYDQPYRFAFFVHPSVHKSYQSIVEKSSIASRSTFYDITQIGVKL